MKSYVPFLSLRYLRFHKVSSGLGILGVTLGVGMVIVVVGVMDGFQARLRKSLIGSTAAVVVFPRYDVDADALAEALKARVPGVVEASPVVKTMTLVSSERGGKHGRLPCQVVGIDPARERVVGDLERRLHFGESQEGDLTLEPPATPEEPFLVPDRERYLDQKAREGKKGVIVGIELARNLRLGLRSKVRLFTVHDRDGAAPDDGGGRKVSIDSEEFHVTGFYNSGDTEVDKMLVLMDRRDALSFFADGIDRQADEVRLLLSDVERCEEVTAAINARETAEALFRASVLPEGRSALEPIHAKSWKEIHRTILGAVETERGLLVVIASFSFIVVAFLIGSTQSMLVVEKTREIGVLRALGGSVGGTAGVFLGNGFFIGTVGALAGWGLGIAVTTNVQAVADFIYRVTGREPFPRSIYRFDQVPIEVQGAFVAVIVGGAILFALLGSLLPALRAAMLDPVESLHHE